MSHDPERLLAALRHHRPVPNAVVRRSVAVRWVATATAGAVAPVGLYLGMSGGQAWLPISGWAAAVIAAGGLLALSSGWMARRRAGFDAQWGFAPLGPEEIRELNAIANADPALGDIVDAWAMRCVESGSNLRGRDLMVLRKKARLYLRAKDDTMPSLSPRR